MQIELKYLIQSALINLSKEVATEEERKVWDDCIEKVRVELPPPKIDADLTSSVIFELSAALGDVTIVGELREKVINKINYELQKYDNYFSFELSRGHLNFKILPTAKNLFINRVIGRGVDCLFRENALFIEGTPRDLKLVRPISSVSVYQEELFKRIRTSGDVELKNFLLTIESGVKKNWNDLLMLLATKADKEISLEVYKKGLNGTENLPWLFEKFMQDTKKILKGNNLNSSLGCSRRSRQSGEINYQREISKLYQVVSPHIEKSADNLLFFRSEIISSHEKHSPELVINTVLRIVRGFYSYYNLPQFRALCALYPLSKEFNRVAELTDVFYLLVSRILTELKTSFEKMQ